MRPVCPRMIFLLFTLLYLHSLIKDKLIDLIERTFQKALLTLHVMTEMHFLLMKNKKYHAWSCQTVCDALNFLLDNIFIRHQAI